MKLSRQAELDRRLSSQSLYYLCKEILGYKDMVPHVHGDLCHFHTAPIFGRFRQATVPRSWFKTWVCTIGKAIWLSLPDGEGLYADSYPHKGPDIRILIASNVIDNAAKMVNKIKREWETNPRLRSAFPELVPDFNKTRWSDHCAELKRPHNYTEGTYTAVGVGGSVISQHFDHISEDDLVYAKKDDFTGQELMPSQEDIENAIGWHKLTFSLLANPQKGTMDNTGTRWAPHDLIDYIRRNEHHYKCFEITSTPKGMWPIPDDSFAIWPERYNKETLEQIRSSQGPKIFETQYLNRPRAGEEIVFDVAYLNIHDHIDEYPENLTLRTYVDLASWGDSKRIARNVILTGAKDSKNHLWVYRVDSGRFTPSDVIEYIKSHNKQFNSKVFVEEIQYQRALRHFAKLDMEKTGHVYNIEQIPYDGRKNAKDLRIQGLEPLVKNGMIHILASMESLKQEMEDYPYGATRDILDCMGFLLRYAKAESEQTKEEERGFWAFDNILDELANRASTNQYPYSSPLVGGQRYD